MLDGLVAFALVSIPIMLVGSSCIDVQEITTSIIIGYVATLRVLFLFILSMALMPKGVAAPFIPNMFADIFIHTKFLLGSSKLFLPNIKFTMGDKSLFSHLLIFVWDSILNMPVHTAYMAHNSRHSLTALFPAVDNPTKTLCGLNIVSATSALISKNNHTLFIS